MRRLVPLMILCAGLASAGCQGKASPQRQARLDEQAFRRDQREDAERLKPEGQRSEALSVGSVGDSLFGGLHYVFITLPHRLWDQSRGITPARFARDMEDSSPDLRRTGILKLSDYAFARNLQGPEVLRYRQIAIADSDPLVRSAAIRALNRARDPKAGAVFVRAMNDPDMLVRLEAAKGLANIPDSAAVPILQQHLTKDESNDVRIACADALRLYKTTDVSRSLITVLTDRDFAVAAQAQKSLRLMTDKDFGYDESAWYGYVSASPNAFR